MRSANKSMLFLWNLSIGPVPVYRSLRTQNTRNSMDNSTGPARFSIKTPCFCNITLLSVCVLVRSLFFYPRGRLILVYVVNSNSSYSMSISLRIGVFQFIFVLLIAWSSTAFQTQAQTVNVALPDTFVTETTVLIPVDVSDVSDLGILSFEFTISFDSTILQINDVVTQNGLASGFLFFKNLSIPGQAVIGAASIDTLKGAGSLFYLEASFLQDGASEMNFERVSFEIDSLTVIEQNGRLRNVSLATVEDQDDFQAQLTLSNNYPNPFNTHTRFSMDLPEPAQVSIEIYNVTGQLKRSYPPRPFSAGTNQLVTVEASALPTGLYYYRVSAHSAAKIRIATGAMTIIH